MITELVSAQTGVHRESWLLFLVIAAFKGGMVLAATVLLCGVLRRASASKRHLIWFLALLSLPLFAVAPLVLPSFQVRIRTKLLAIDSMNGRPPIFQPDELADGSREKIFGPAPAQEQFGAKPPLEEIAQPSPPSKTGLERSALLILTECIPLLWSLGFLCVLGSLLANVFSIRRLTNSAQPMIEPEWDHLLWQASERLRLRRPIRLWRSPEAIMPMTWGLWKPVSLLPVQAESWARERQRMVLLHEAAHVERWDCVTQTIAWIVCAFYWFNPFAWVALRRMRIERERACDDLVLMTGERACDYAGELLAIAKGFRTGKWAGAAAVAMAQPSQLEQRLLSILENTRNRRSLPRRAVAFAFARMVVLTLPLAMPQAVAGNRAEKASAPDLIDAARNVSPAPASVSQRARELFDAQPSDVSTLEYRLITNEILKLGPGAIPALLQEFPIAGEADTLEKNRKLWQKAARLIAEFGPLAESAVPELVRLLQENDDPWVINQICMILAEIGPGAKDALPALLERAKASDGAVHALSNIDPGSRTLLVAFIEMLDSKDVSNPHVRSTAAFALGAWGDKAEKAVPALSRALFSDDPYLCYCAADCLGKIGSPDALSALREAMTHKLPAVRAIGILSRNAPV